MMIMKMKIVLVLEKITIGETDDEDGDFDDNDDKGCDKESYGIVDDEDQEIMR